MRLYRGRQSSNAGGGAYISGATVPPPALSAAFVEHEGSFYPVPCAGWDELVSGADLHARVQDAIASGHPVEFDLAHALAPVVTQEVWAAGVTYFRSRSARMEESREAGGGSFYDRVYHAQRPELFFKSVGAKVVDPGGSVRIRRDATWSVPEPELTLLLSAQGRISGYTIGNDMSSRDIEGENPLYLPQAKVYDGSCALGPCILLTQDPLPATTAIALEIARAGAMIFTGQTTLAELKRNPVELAEYLFRESSFPAGAMLMTGTGIVPPDEVSLRSGDAIRISITGIGVLENIVA